jgi:hypothetical protein
MRTLHSDGPHCPRIDSAIRYRHRLSLLALPLILLPGCSRTDQGRIVYSERDGVRIAQIVGGPRSEGPLFDFVSDLVLGIDEGEPEWQMFSGYPRLLVAPDGRMVLADTRRYELYIVDRDGRLLHRLGRRGSGPGEFENLWFVHWAEWGREFWVEDQRLIRVSRFDLEGIYLGSFNYAEQRSNFSYVQDLGRRRFLAVASGSSVENVPDRFSLLDGQLHWVKDLTEIPGQELLPAPGPSGGYVPKPFSVAGGMVPFPDGRMLAYYPYGPRLTVHDTSGVPVLHIERDWEMLPVTGEEKERTRERYRSSNSAQMQEFARTVVFPDRHGAFTRPYLDDEGRIWLLVRSITEGGEAPTPTRYLFEIYDSDGDWLAVQETDFLPNIIQGGFVYRFFTAKSGAIRLERLRIVTLQR